MSFVFGGRLVPKMWPTWAQLGPQDGAQVVQISENDAKLDRTMDGFQDRFFDHFPICGRLGLHLGAQAGPMLATFSALGALENHIENKADVKSEN